MKNIFLLIGLMFWAAISSAQAPNKISYQAVVRSSNNQLVANSNIGIQISVINGSSTGTVSYAETHSALTNSNGLFSIIIGNGTMASGSLSGIDWLSGPYFIKSEIDLSGGSNYTLVDTKELLSVPYALSAPVTGPAALPLTGNNAGDILYWDGSKWIKLSAGNTGETLTICNSIPTWGSCTGLPAISTTSPTSITSSSVLTGGVVSSTGSSPIITRGVCYSINPNPTITNSIITSGTGIGSYSASLSGLNTNTTYYARAFATNSNGTAYGNQITFTTKLAIGQYYQGGIIFYIDGSGQHGLIAAPNDQSAASIFGCNSLLISPNDTIFGSGPFNSIVISSNCGGGSAASICVNLVWNGYDDWFLPSKLELDVLYQNKALVGNFSSDNYWSSSQQSYGSALCKHFGTGTNSALSKNFKYRVRAIRSF